MAAKTSESQGAEQRAVVSDNKSARPGYKSLVRPGLGLILLAILALTLVLWLKPASNNANQCSKASRQSMLRQAAPLLFKLGQQSQLKPVVNQIQQFPNYQQDPNCDVIMMAYFVNGYDSSNSKRYLTLFNKVYNPKTGLSPALNVNSSQLQILLANVNILQDPAHKYSLISNVVEVPAR